MQANDGSNSGYRWKFKASFNSKFWASKKIEIKKLR